MRLARTPEQVVAIFMSLAKSGVAVLATRATEEVYGAVKAAVPEAQFHQAARCITLSPAQSQSDAKGTIAVLCAGTSDLPVAEEAAVTAELFGSRVIRLYDVGGCRAAPAAGGKGSACRSRCSDRLRGNGRRAAIGGGRTGFDAGDCGADLSWLRGQFCWRCGPFGHVELL